MGDMGILVIVLWRVIGRLLRRLGRGVLLVPVAAMAPVLFGLRPWTVAAVLLAVVVAVWRPVVAAVLLPVTMVVAGISGLVVAATTPAPSWWAVSALVAIKRRLVSGHVAAKVAQIKSPAAPAGRRSVVARVAPVPGSRTTVKPWRPVPATVRPRPGSRATVTVPARPPTVNGVPGSRRSRAGARIRADQSTRPRWTAGAPAGRWSWTVRGGRPPVQFHRAGGGFWPGYLVPLALLLLTLGLWLLPRTAGRAAHAHRRAGLLPAAADAGESLGHSPDPRRAARPDRVRRAPVDGRAGPGLRRHRGPVAGHRRGPGPGGAGRVRGPGLHDRGELAVAAPGLAAARPALRRHPGRAAARRPCWPGPRPARSS